MAGEGNPDRVEVGLEVRERRDDAAGVDRREGADDRDVAADDEADLAEVDVEAGGEALVRGEERGRAVGIGEQAEVRLGEVPGVGADQPHGVARQAEANGLAGEGLEDERLVVQQLGVADEGEAAVAVADEEAGSLRSHGFDVEIDEGIVLHAGTAAEGDVLDAGGLKVGEARIAGRRLADDDRIGDPALDDALEAFERILLRPAEQQDEVEVVRAQRAPHALEHGEEARVGARGAGRDHRGDHAGAAAAQAAARLVRNVAGAHRGGLDARPGVRVDVGAIVQGP